MNAETLVQGSLRQRLLIQLLAVFALLAVLLYASVNWIANQAADKTQDNTLGASAAIVAEQVSLIDGEVTVDMPYAALAMLGAAGDDRVFYKVALSSGALLTGYGDLPDPEEAVTPGQTVFYTSRYSGDPVRIAMRARVLFNGARRETVLVAVAQTREAYGRITSAIAVAAALVGLTFFVLAGGFSVLAVQRSLKPLAKIEQSLSERTPHDLTALRTSVPAEVASMVASLNRFLARLRETLRATEDFIAEAAHRVRTPLASVRAQAELALRQSDNEGQSAALGRMIRTVDQTARATSQILDHAMVTYRADGMKRERVELNALGREVCAEIEGAAELRDIRIELNPADPPVYVDGDKILLVEALRNLLDNAVKYSPAESLVSLSMEQCAGGEAAIVVADQGRGLPDGDADAIRTRFRRGSNVDDVVGSGLGLTIVEQVASAHGGALEIGPNEPKGVRAVLRLPADGGAMG